jgi:MFS family permease
LAFLRALRHRHLAILWLSQVLSAIGDNFYAITIVWMAVRLSGSGAGYVVAAQSIAGLIFGLIGGVFADRWNRRRTMIGVDLLRALAVGTLPILSLLGWLQLWHLAAAGAAIGGLGALFDPALQASLPALRLPAESAAERADRDRRDDEADRVERDEWRERKKCGQYADQTRRDGACQSPRHVHQAVGCL